jgi:hypothetical protein
MMGNQGSRSQQDRDDKGLGLSDFAMNQVQIEEKRPPFAHAASSARVALFLVLLAVAVAVGLTWSRLKRGGGHLPLDQEMDPRIRQEAVDFRESLLEGTSDLSGKLLDASFEGPRTLSITLTPAEKGKAADAAEVKKTLARVLAEFRLFLGGIHFLEPGTEIVVNAYRMGTLIDSAKYRVGREATDVELKSPLGAAVPEGR